MTRHATALLLMAILLHVPVAWNAVNHPPDVGYDAKAHLSYARTLAAGRMPTPPESYLFYMPPLYYSVPAVLQRCGIDANATAKAMQALHVLFSAGILLLVLNICAMLRPGDWPLKYWCTGMLLLLPVYCKTLAFVRAEPVLALLVLGSVNVLLRLHTTGRQPLVSACLAGALTAMAVLTKQSGWVLLAVTAPVICVIAWRRHGAGQAVQATVATVAVTILLAAWFPWHQKMTYGTMLAFNRPPAETLSLHNQPRSFYTGLGNGMLFTDPVRSAFNNQLLPILYADTWGDYWCYFLVAGRDLRSGAALQGNELIAACAQQPRPAWLATNRESIAGYLGRANLVSLPAALVLAGGILFGVLSLARSLRRDAPDGDRIPAVIALFVLACGASYFLFLLRHPYPGKGDTIKTAYLFHVLPLAALLAGELCRRLQAWRPRAAAALAAVLAVVYLHNLPLCFTRFCP